MKEMISCVTGHTLQQRTYEDAELVLMGIPDLTSSFRTGSREALKLFVVHQRAGEFSPYLTLTWQTALL